MYSEGGGGGRCWPGSLLGLFRKIMSSDIPLKPFMISMTLSCGMIIHRVSLGTLEIVSVCSKEDVSKQGKSSTVSIGTSKSIS